jgi:hypothetical protein
MRLESAGAQVAVAPAAGTGLNDVFAPNRELFGCLYAHLDAPSGTTQQGDLDGAVGEQLRHGHGFVHTVSWLDND